LTPTSTDTPGGRALIRTLWVRARALFDNTIAHQRLYSPRRYQIKAAVRAILLALQGRNDAIELPTGTGKTVIACIAAVLWKSLNPGSRVLFIVPSRTLVVQHFDVALWVARDLKVDRITDQQSGDPGALRSTLLRADFVISTPGVLASALKRGVVDDDVQASFDLIIIDEFDQFVVLEEADFTTEARYAEHWKSLSGLLPEQARHLITSATLGLSGTTTSKPGRGSKGEHRSHLIEQMLHPVVIRVPETAYAAVVPLNPVRAVVIEDLRIQDLLDGVHTSKGRMHIHLDEEIRFTGDFRDVERRAPQICSGPDNRVVHIRSAMRHFENVVVTEKVKAAFCGITGFLMMPQHIFEDLTLGLSTQSYDCTIKNSLNETVYVENATVLSDEREDDHFHFLAGRKTERAIAIVESRSKIAQRGVVFVRTLTLLEGLKPLFSNLGLPFFELTGEKADHERRQAIAGFRASTNGLLLMTRTTGGRGLDLPFAHYALFYSPKTEPAAMWQEMSRIRSIVSDPKDIYVLCYGADEACRLTAVVAALLKEGRRITIA
jgi:superfamily II DNA or RNA helicase